MALRTLQGLAVLAGTAQNPFRVNAPYARQQQLAAFMLDAVSGVCSIAISAGWNAADRCSASSWGSAWTLPFAALVVPLPATAATAIA